MPTLDFPSKDIIYAHHLTAPYCPLETDKKKSIGEGGLDGNLIINADNLYALKTLLPRYGGRVNCIYIDPPYNTGKGEWIYNDRVDSPTMRRWLKEQRPVDGEDQERHDKWCCMMWPRLVLLKELLAETGVIFISIDDNEQASLKLLMDEIFGEENFVAQIVAQTNPRGRSLDILAKTFEYILVYAKERELVCTQMIPKTERAIAEYKESDEHGNYRLLELRNRNPVFNRKSSPSMFFPIYTSPETGKVSLYRTSRYTQEVLPKNSKGEDGCWTWSKGKVEKGEHLLTSKKVQTGNWRIFRKDYLNEKSSLTKSKTLWVDSGMNHERGREGLAEIFQTSGSEVPFNYPKSVSLIKNCLMVAAGQDAIVFDSFAGSGATAQAVLELNKQDGGNRKFILVECEDYADKVTAERVRRVIKGIPAAKDANLKNGLGGEFTFCKLGDELTEDGILSGKKLPSFDTLARHLFHCAAGRSLPDGKFGDGKLQWFVGDYQNYRLYLIYKPDKKWLTSIDAALSQSALREILKHKPPQKQAVVYAAAKFLKQKELSKSDVIWAPLPFALYGSPTPRTTKTPLEKQSAKK